MKTRVLVHGAESFIGRRLVAALEASDWAEPRPVTTLDITTLEREMRGAQAVVHSVTGGSRTVESAARALYALLSKASTPRRIVHLSSMTVYGSASGTITEYGELRADAGAYSRAHRAAEALAATQPDVVMLRPGAEYGADCIQWSGRIAKLLVARRLGDLGAAGDGRCNLLYIEDLITAFQRALLSSHLSQRCFNLADPSPLTWNEYLVNFAIALRAVPVRRISARRLHLEASLMAPPLKAAELFARAAHLPAAALPPPITASMLAVFGQDIRLDVERAEQLLGLRWTHRDQGIEQAAAWYRSLSMEAPVAAADLHPQSALTGADDRRP